MKYFLDTEFSERGGEFRIMLISIGIVAEDGRELYLINRDFQSRHANPWVKANVLPLLPDRKVYPYDSPRRRMEALAWVSLKAMPHRIREFIGDDPEPEFWGYYSDFDWVVFAQLFGDMSALPVGWPMRCNDLRQWLDHEALNHVSQPDDAPHDALQDARWVRATYLEYVSKLWGDAA